MSAESPHAGKSEDEIADIIDAAARRILAGDAGGSKNGVPPHSVHVQLNVAQNTWAWKRSVWLAKLAFGVVEV